MSNTFEQSKLQMREASRYLAGGVSSNFRLGTAPTPLVIQRGEGAYLVDADGNVLIDYYLGMGPMLLGHRPRAVIEAACRQLDTGVLFAAQTSIEIEAARLVCELVPCAERVRFASSGTEAIQAAIRLARAVSRRQVIVRFEGHYHGWLDNICWNTDPASDLTADTAHGLGKVAASGGQDPHTAESLEIFHWGDPDPLEARLLRGDVAAVIMEPAMCNGGVIPPPDGYLGAVRAACSRTGTVLIFDEVITGFRLARGGAQALFEVTPDLAVFGKAIASGFPVAALAGRAALMERFATGEVLHGGTYNGHPVNMAATVATLRELMSRPVHTTIERSGQQLMDGLSRIFDRCGISARVQGFPAVFYATFGSRDPISRYRDTLLADRERYRRFTVALLERGVRALERGTWFVSFEHDESIVDRTLAIAEKAARCVA